MQPPPVAPVVDKPVPVAAVPAVEIGVDTPLREICYTLGGQAIIPIRWFKDGRVFCRVEIRDCGFTICRWAAYQLKKIKGAPESVVNLLGESPVEVECDTDNCLNDLGIV